MRQGGLRRLLISLVLVLPIAALGHPDVVLDYPPTIVAGTLETIEYNSQGTGSQDFPSRAFYSTSVNPPGTGYSVLWECYKMRGFNKITGRYYPITPQAVYSISHGWFSGTREIELNGPFWSWYGSRTNPEERAGEFVLRLSYRPGSGPYTVVDLITWRISASDDFRGNTGGGGGSAGDPVNQQGFWESLFVPGQDCIDDLKSAANDLANWGPFGWYNVISGRIQDNSAQRVDPTPYVIELGIPSHPSAPGVGGVYHLDLRPYQVLIRFIRMVIAGVLWYVFIFRIGRRVWEKL